MESDSRSITMLSSSSAGGYNTSSGAEDAHHRQSSALEGKRKAAMTAEERASHGRERNRVHARKTRARKKQYVEEVKELVENMQVQKAAVERQKEDAAREEETEIAKWEAALTKIMDLRFEGVTDEDKWKELLSDNFRFTLPLTPYRPYDPADIAGHRRVLVGIEGMVSDVKSLKVMCADMAKKCRAKAGVPTDTEGGAGAQGEDGRVHLECYLGIGNFMFSGSDGIMCMLNMRTLDARRYGSALEIEASGMLRACFAEDGKLQELDVMFDGVSVHQQIQKAIRSNPSQQLAAP